MNTITIDCYTDDEAAPLDGHGGLWPQASYMRHSCVPNTARGFIDDLMIVRATRDIKAGEEIFCTWYLFDDSYASTKCALLDLFQITCDCALYKAEELTTPADRLRRSKLLDARDECPKRTESSNEFNMITSAEAVQVIVQGEKLIKQLEATYRDAMYPPGLPRRGLSRMYVTLGWAHLQTENPSASDLALQCSAKSLMTRGSEVHFNAGPGLQLINIHGVALPDAITRLRTAGTIAAVKSKAVAMQFNNVAKYLHQCKCGDTANYHSGVFESLPVTGPPYSIPPF